MDLATVIGLLSGIGLLLFSILLGGSLEAFINIPSLAITIGGACAATMINFPLEKLLGAMTVAQKAFFYFNRVVGLEETSDAGDVYEFLRNYLFFLNYNTDISVELARALYVFKLSAILG